MQKIYVDTNIFLDFWLDRKTKIAPAGLFAEKMFEDLTECKYFLVTSNYIMMEIKENINFFEEVRDLFETLRSAEKIKVIKIKQGMIDKAKKIASKKDVPIHDAIHAIVAKSEGAILVTRDKHFQNIADFITVLKPEELTF